MLYMIQFFNKDQKDLIDKYIEIFKIVTTKYFYIYDCLFIKIDDATILNNICKKMQKDKLTYLKIKIEDYTGFYSTNLIKFISGEIENSDKLSETKQQKTVKRVLKHLQLLT